MVSDFKNAFPGIFNFIVGILAYALSRSSAFIINFDWTLQLDRGFPIVPYCFGRMVSVVFKVKIKFV